MVVITVTEKRIYATELMKSREKKNSYTQGSKRSQFFSGYSDCSSAVRECIKKAAGIDIGSNTSAQINNRNKIGLIVHETDGYYPDESKLLPGDCIYFKGNTGHPLDVGHVEMYTGPNECWGHGSGKGPTKKDLKDYCKSRATSKKRYFMAIRWILDEDEGSADEGAAGSDVPDYNTFEIAKGTWNVRKGPSTEYESVGKVKGGTKVEGVDTDGWIPIKYKGEVMWIGPSAVKK